MATPTRRARPDAEEEQEEPTRRRRVADDVEEEQEETRPRRRRPWPQDADDDDGEEAAPEEDYEDAPAAPRARRTTRASLDDTEDAPRTRRRPGGSAAPSGPAGRRPGGSRPSGRIASGWGGYNRVKEASSDFEKKFKPTPEGSIAQLLEPEPFAAFARHWLDLADGKRAVICPASLEVGEDEEELPCALCDVGDKPNTPKAYLNVALLSPNSSSELQVWEIGSQISDQLQVIDKGIGRKTSLTDIYILASSSGSGLNTKYSLEPIFAEDLAEFGVKPLTPKQLDKFELYDASLYEVPTERELNKLADEIA